MTVIAKLNKTISKSIKDEIIKNIEDLEYLNNYNEIDLKKQILSKELEISYLLDSVNILDIYNNFENDIKKYRTLINLTTNDKIKLLSFLTKKEEIIEKENSKNTLEFKKEHKQLDYNIPIEQYLDSIYIKINNNEILKFDEIPNINDTFIQNSINRIKQLHILLRKENNKLIKNNIETIKTKIINEQKQLFKAIVNYIRNECNKFFEKNNIDYTFYSFNNDYKEIYIKLNELITKKKKELGIADSINIVSNEYKDLINYFNEFNINIINYTKDNYLKLEAENDLFNRLIKHCKKYNEEVINRRKK